MIPTLDVAHWDEASRAQVRAAFLAQGVLLLRTSGTSLDDFEALTHAVCAQFHEVGTRQSLRQAAGDGYTTEVFRHNFILLGHAEGRYRPWPPPPDVCFFLCVTPPAAAGGETTVVDGAAMLARIPDPLRERLAAHGVVYESTWEPARWQAEFGVADVAALQALLRALPGVQFDLDAAGRLHLLTQLPAITRARDGSAVFANGVLAHLPRITHPHYQGLPVHAKATNRVHVGDGHPLTDDEANQLIDAHDAVLHRHRWQAGEILLLDNTRFMHGRMHTDAPCERVLISRFGRLRGA